jgi:hypothetical protein
LEALPMEFDELDSYVEELFNRPVYLPRDEFQDASPGPSASPTVDDGNLLYYWHEPYEQTFLPGTEPAAPTQAWDPGEPLSAWGMIKGLLLLVAGLLLIITLSEAGLI